MGLEPGAPQALPRHSPVPAPNPCRSHGPHEGDEEGHDQRCHRLSGRGEDGVEAKQVRAVFAELREVAYAEVAKTEQFTIPQLVRLKLKHKPARKAGTKMMFGKEVRVAAKPASKVVKAFPAKGLKDSI